MQLAFLKNADICVPQHFLAAASRPGNLKSAVDAAHLTDMWETILTQDYDACDLQELSSEKRDEFLKVMSLLLKAFDR
ncbi:hypothetical protein [Roseibium sp.]|uniref:hypothetical protein n=1 Tax=Roseibium sp. TaxID=1936156 RepID=UPI003D14CAB1